MSALLALFAVLPMTQLEHCKDKVCWEVNENGWPVCGETIPRGNNLTWTVQCYKEGDILDIQCLDQHPNDCWCVDNTGTQKECDNELTCENKKVWWTEVYRKYEKVAFLSRNINTVLFKYAYIPQCRPDETYRPIQCSSNRENCWCVDTETSQPVSCSEVSMKKDCPTTHGVHRHHEIVAYKDTCQICQCLGGSMTCRALPSCVPLALRYDCTWNSTTQKPFTREHQEWCCEYKGIRCPPEQKYAREIKKRCLQTKRGLRQNEEFCCNMGVDCEAQEFTCKEDTVMDPTSSDWCCTEDNIGCLIQCDSERLTVEEKQWCCDKKGVLCGSMPAKTISTPVKRILLAFNCYELLENPRKVMRKMRVSLLRADSRLIDTPSDLQILNMGCLKYGLNVPGYHENAWRVPIDPSWNVDNTETLMMLGLTVNPNAIRTAPVPHPSDDGIFVDYSITGKSRVESKLDSIETALHSLVASSSGVYANNCEGYCYNLVPLGSAADVHEDMLNGHDSSDDGAGNRLSLAALFGICIGALFVASSLLALVTLYSKYNPTTPSEASSVPATPTPKFPDHENRSLTMELLPDADAEPSLTKC